MTRVDVWARKEEEEGKITKREEDKMTKGGRRYDGKGKEDIYNKKE